MKPLLALTFFFLLGLICTCRAQVDVPGLSTQARMRTPVATSLRFIIKERTLWESRSGQRYLNANLLYNRATGDVGDMGVCRSSSYVIPLLYGIRLNQTLALEGGLFGGLNRNRLAGTSMISPDLGPARSDIAYGLLVGMSHRLRSDVDFKLRYRYDRGAGFHAWSPVQAGLSFNF